MSEDNSRGANRPKEQNLTSIVPAKTRTLPGRAREKIGPIPASGCCKQGPMMSIQFSGGPISWQRENAFRIKKFEKYSGLPGSMRQGQGNSIGDTPMLDGHSSRRIFSSRNFQIARSL